MADDIIGRESCRLDGAAHKARNCTFGACALSGFCTQAPRPAPVFPPLIALSGKSGSGKDAIGREVLRPLGFTQFALAWHMKNEACGHGFSYEEVHGSKPPHVRTYLQQRGTEDGWKKHGKDYWLNIADAWLRTLRENCGLSAFYLTDVRFPHEVRWVQQRGGVVLRVVGRGGLSGEAAQHSSETALDSFTGFDGYLDNSGEGFADVRAALLRHLNTPRKA